MAYTMAQAVNAKLAFNPLSSPDGQGEIFVGQNQNRLTAAMAEQQWEDPRFVTRGQIDQAGWTVAEDAVPVQITVRDKGTGEFDNKVMFNASQVVGIPSLEDMLEVAQSRLTPQKVVSTLREDSFADAVGASVRTAGVAVEGEALMVAPARVLEMQDVGEFPVRSWREEEEKRRRAAESAMLDARANEEEEAELVVGPGKREKENEGRDTEDVIEVMPVIRDKIVGDEGPEHVGEKKLDHIASTLLGTVFKERTPGSGEYVREGEKKAAFMDKGGSLLIRDKNQDAYQAVMELANSKGWKEIELSGKRESVAKGWLEAQMLGITVTNYVPTEKDMAELDKRRTEQQMMQAGKGLATDVPAGAKLATSGIHVGPVVDVKDGYVIQKSGRSDFVAHKLADFAQPPKVGDSLDVQYREGRAMSIEGRGRGQEQGGGREIGGR